MTVSRPVVLLIEDEPAIIAPLAEALEREGFTVHAAASAAQGLDLFEALRPDIVLLDLMLPDGSGLDVCRALRARSEVGIVILTARGEETDRVVGLELGADDYVVKPFSARELSARIRSLLRRLSSQQTSQPTAPLTVGDVRLDPSQRAVTVAGAPVELARREFDLLEALMREPKTVITRERLIEEVWDRNWFGSTKTLDVHISSLRKKLGDESRASRYIHTVRGVGFRFGGFEDPRADKGS